MSNKIEIDPRVISSIEAYVRTHLGEASSYTKPVEAAVPADDEEEAQSVFPHYQLLTAALRELDKK